MKGTCKQRWKEGRMGESKDTWRKRTGGKEDGRKERVEGSRQGKEGT